MKKKSEKNRDKPNTDRKSEKSTRKYRRHSRRRKRSVSSSPERDESGTEDNETSVRSSQEDSEEEVPPSSAVEIGAVITADDNSDNEESQTKRSSKSVTNDRTPKLENAEEDDWKEDVQFWEEGAVPGESADQKHKDKEGKSDIWKVKNPNGSGGQLKLCIVRPQEPVERSPRRRKRLSRTSSNQQRRESGEEIDCERKHSGDSSEEKQSSSSDERRQRKEKVKSCETMEEKSTESSNAGKGVKQEDKTKETIEVETDGAPQEKEPSDNSEIIEMNTVEIPLPEGQPVSAKEVPIKCPSITGDSSESNVLPSDLLGDKSSNVEAVKENGVLNSLHSAVTNTEGQSSPDKQEGVIVDENSNKSGLLSVEDKQDACDENNSIAVSDICVPDEEESKCQETGDLISESPVEEPVHKHVSDGECGSSEGTPSRERQKSSSPVVHKHSDTGSKEKGSRRKSRESSSSADGRRRSRSKESSSRSHHSDVRSSRREGKESRRRSRLKESRKKSPETPPISKHKKKYSRSKSQSPQRRREKISLRRSYSTKSDKGESKPSKEENADQEKSESAVSGRKEDKENEDKKSSEVVNHTSEEPSAAIPRKRRWGQRNSSRPSKKPVLSISTDSLKNLIPGAKPVPIGEVQLTQDEDSKREKDSKENDDDKWDREKSSERESQERTNDKKTVVMLPDAPRINVAVTDDQQGKAVTRKISIVSDDARMLQRSPSPPRHKVSSVLFITNLVRPFTVNQLKELLARTGTIVSGGFWIDKIKSKCYVEYEKESEARETRHALHGVRWPVSNPKQLCVDFGKKEDMELAQMLAETDLIPRKTEPLKVDRSVEGWVAEQAREKEMEREQREREKEREQRERERERLRAKERAHAVPLEALEHSRNAKLAASVREWDLGKIGQVSPNERERDLRYEADRNRERERKMRKEKIHRSRSPSLTEVTGRKSKKKEEDAPAKLLDDLFRKTKTTPCIYWLPLTAEQIVVKEEMRRKHMAEHERRMAEMRKADRMRSQQRQQRRTGERDKRRRRSGSDSPKK